MRDRGQFLHLPFPPSANDYWRWGRGRMYRSGRAGEYIDLVRRHHWQSDDPWSGKLSLRLEFFVPTSQRGPDPDLDNLLKILIDAMSEAGYWGNDRQVKHIEATLNPNRCPLGVVHVWIAPLGAERLFCAAPGAPCDR